MRAAPCPPSLPTAAAPALIPAGISSEEGSLAWKSVAIWAHLTEPGISQERACWGLQHPWRGVGGNKARDAALTSFHSLLPAPCTKRTTTAERGAEPCRALPRCAHTTGSTPRPPTWVRFGEGVHVQQVPGGTEPGVSGHALAGCQHPTRWGSPCPPRAGLLGDGPNREGSAGALGPKAPAPVGHGQEAGWKEPIGTARSSVSSADSD